MPDCHQILTEEGEKRLRRAYVAIVRNGEVQSHPLFSLSNLVLSFEVESVREGEEETGSTH